ncbi:two-component sensor kinase [Escherichia coli]|uniref:Two-component sensor kinase n=1 Tax=Escherichia coli TaxID=562 RepID=A0A376LM68_ECOLX|nr:two-component sensor kinase [Escherichia coli]
MVMNNGCKCSADALGEQYAQHGNWRFLRNNDRFVFQILRSLEHDNNEDKPGPRYAATRLAHAILGG